MGVRVTPKTGGGDVNKTPRSGSKSAPSDAPAVRSGNQPRNPRGGKSAPTEAPAVRTGLSIPTNGDRDTPTSVKSNIINEPPQPSKPSVDRRIT